MIVATTSTAQYIFPRRPDEGEPTVTVRMGPAKEVYTSKELDRLIDVLQEARQTISREDD